MSHVYFRQGALNDQVCSKTTPFTPYKEPSLQCEDVLLLVSRAATLFCRTRATAFNQGSVRRLPSHCVCALHRRKACWTRITNVLFISHNVNGHFTGTKTGNFLQLYSVILYYYVSTWSLLRSTHFRQRPDIFMFRHDRRVRLVDRTSSPLPWLHRLTKMIMRQRFPSVSEKEVKLSHVWAVWWVVRDKAMDLRSRPCASHCRVRGKPDTCQHELFRIRAFNFFSTAM
jgi:hypothetical protein